MNHCECNMNCDPHLTTRIKHVYGNVLRLAIPLTLRSLMKDGGTIVATDSDFIPSSEYPVNVVFGKGNKNIAIPAEMDGNVAIIEEKGKMPVGTYDITVECRDDLGQPYRFKKDTVLQVVDVTAEAGIEPTIEYEAQTWYLDAAIFLATTEIGSMGEEIERRLEDVFGDVDYDAENKVIKFYDKNKTHVLGTIDSRPFIVDGTVDDVYIDVSRQVLVVILNEDAGGRRFSVPLYLVFDNYYKKDEVDNLVSRTEEGLRFDFSQKRPLVVHVTKNGSSYSSPVDFGAIDNAIREDGRIVVACVNNDIFYQLLSANRAEIAFSRVVALDGHQELLIVDPHNVWIMEDVDLAPGGGGGGYEPPAGGIPKSDLAQSVQETLDDVVNKVDKETGKGLSTNDYTTAEKTKLAGIAAGAEVNVQPNWTQTNTSADDYIKNKPTLATVATSGSYNDLSNKPTLFSGNYNDLTNKPTIPSAQVNADWNASSGVMEILNKPTIPTKFSDLVDDSDYITAQDVASIVVGSADVVITETASHINITFVTTSISFTPNTTMSLWAGQKVGTLTVSGTHLKQDITLTVPTNFTAQVSGGTAAQSITIPQTGGEVTGVSVTITYTGADSGSYNGSITATSGSTTASVGLVYSQYQGATIIAGTIGTIKAAMGGSQIGELNVSGVKLEDDISASVGNGDFTICATQNGTYGTTATISKASAEASGGATLFVKYTPSSGTSTASDRLTLTTPRNGVNISKTVDLTGAVVSLTVSESSLSFNTTVGTPAAQTFTVRGANLTQDISISASGTGFSVSPATIDKDDAGTAQTVTVTYNPSAAGTNTGTVTIQSSGLSETIDLSGTAEAVPEFSSSNSYQQKIGGIYYKVIMNGNNPTTNLQVCNSSYSINAAANSYSGDVVIPSTVSALLDGNQTSFSVTEIRANAFSSCSSLNSVIVPDSVTSLGNYCFSSSNAMKKIVLGSGCTDLTNNEFYNNNSQWEEIDFGENVASVGGNGFKLKDTAIVTLRYAGYNGTTPKRVDFNSAPFSNTNGTRPCAASLYVPSTHVQSYKESNYWGNPNGGANQQFQQANIFAITE